MKLIDGQRVRVDFPPRPELGRKGGTMTGRVLGWPKSDEHVLVIPDDRESTERCSYVRACWPWVTPLSP